MTDLSLLPETMYLLSFEIATALTEDEIPSSFLTISWVSKFQIMTDLSPLPETMYLLSFEMATVLTQS